MQNNNSRRRNAGASRSRPTSAHAHYALFFLRTDFNGPCGMRHPIAFPLVKFRTTLAPLATATTLYWSVNKLLSERSRLLMASPAPSESGERARNHSIIAHSRFVCIFERAACFGIERSLPAAGHFVFVYYANTRYVRKLTDQECQMC